MTDKELRDAKEFLEGWEMWWAMEEYVLPLFDEIDRLKGKLSMAYRIIKVEAKMWELKEAWLKKVEE